MVLHRQVVFSLLFACFFLPRIIKKLPILISFFLIRSRSTELTGEDLRREAFHIRLTCVGSAIEVMKDMDQQSLEVVQSAVAEVRREQIGREDIIKEMEKYLASGTYSGMV